MPVTASDIEAAGLEIVDALALTNGMQKASTKLEAAKSALIEAQRRSDEAAAKLTQALADVGAAKQGFYEAAAACANYVFDELGN